MAGKKDVEAGSAFVRLLLRDDMTKKLVSVLNNSGKALQNFGADIAKFGAVAAGAGAAITGPLIGAVSHFMGVGDSLDKMAARTGVSVNALAELGFAAEQTGGDVDMLEKGFFGLSRSYRALQQGSKTTADAFSRIGMSLRDLQGLSPDEQLVAVADGLAQVEDMAVRGAVAQQIFGRAGRQLLPMLSGAKGGLEELTQEARDLGLSPDDLEESTRAAADLTDAYNRIKRSAGMVAYEVGAALAPALSTAADVAINIVKTVREWVSQNKGLIRTVAGIGAVLLAGGAAIVTFGGAVMFLGGFLMAAGKLVAALGAAVSLLASPVGIVAVAVVAGAAAFALYTKSGQRMVAAVWEVMGNLLDTVKDTLGGIWDAIVAGDLELAGEIAFTGMQLVARQALEAIRGLAGDTVSSIVQSLLKGDMEGAWSTVADRMLQVWRNFRTAVVETFAGIVVSVHKMWTDMQNKISKQLLEWATQDTIVGAVVRQGLGIDPVAAERSRQEMIGGTQAALGMVREQLSVETDPAELQRLEESEQRLLDRIAALGESDALRDWATEAQRIVDEMTAQTQDAFTDTGFGGTLLAMAQEERQARDELQQAIAESLATDSQEAQDRVKALEKRLAELRKRAGEMRGDAERKRRDGAPIEEFEMPGTAAAMSNLVTFSAAGAAASGFLGTGGPQERMVAALEKIEKLAEKQADAAEENVVRGDQIVGAVDRLTQQFSYG